MLQRDMEIRPKLSSTTHVRRLKDIRVPERFYQRYCTGFEVLDQVFGGDIPGVLPGGAYLVTGMPGAGKSTLMLQVIDSFAKAGKKVVYNIGEESPYQVKMAADRIGINGDFDLIEVDDVNELMLYCIENAVDIVVQDSLQSLTDIEQPERHGEGLWLDIGKKLIEMSKDFVITSFIVNHVTKGGQMRGKNELVHDIDGHLHISINKDTGNRVLELMKNRFGPAQMPYEFTLTKDGIDLKKQAEGTTVEGTRTSQRRTGIMDVIRKLLLSGRRLSGYSHEEEPEIVELGISGGAMRAFLRMARKELEDQGSRFIEERVNGRGTVRIDGSAATS